MANVFDKQTKSYLKSRNTPDYLEGGSLYEADRFIINPTFVPDCKSKYIFIEADNVLREMTQVEKDEVDYVAPPPEPTVEEIAAKAEVERQVNIKKEIGFIYSLTDEIGIIREALAKMLPDDVDVQAWNDIVVAAKAKYSK